MRREMACLDESNPIPRVEYACPHELLPCSISDVYTTAACGSWASTRCLLFIRSLLQKRLRRLGEYESDRKLTTSVFKSVLDACRRFSFIF